MALRIYNNIYSLNTQRHLERNNNAVGLSLERLSSGLRINRAGDDPAGLAISEALRADVKSLNQALRNTNDGISMINTAEGALSETSSILSRMRELAIQSSTGTVGDDERVTIELEFAALLSEIERISAVTEFNGQKLLDGSLASGAAETVALHIGFQATTNDKIDLNAAVDLTAVNSTTLGISASTVATATGAEAAISLIDTAIETVAVSRGKLGAVQNRLVHTVANLSSSAENLQAAESKIRDADYASEVAQFTRNQVLVQASTSMLAQANLIPQSVLQLLV